MTTVVTTQDVTVVLELVDAGVGLREISGRTAVPVSMVRALVAEHRPEIAEKLAVKTERKRVTKTGRVVRVSTGEKGLCSVCGHEVALMPGGNPYPHKQRRVTAGFGGKARVYATRVNCPGVQEPAEALGDAVDDAPMPVGPMNAERWPTARELAAERFDLPNDVPSRNGSDEPGHGAPATSRSGPDNPRRSN